MGKVATRSVAANEQPQLDFDPDTLRAANINPETFLATDYLNHYNEVLMLIEMLGSLPESFDDIMNWKPLGYREYFVQSNYRDKELAVACTDLADEAVLDRLRGFIDEANEIIEEIVSMLSAAAPEFSSEILTIAAFRATEEIRPLLSQSGNLINGGLEEDVTAQEELFEDDLSATSSQDDIDALFD